MPRSLYIVQSNAEVGREEEYNRWYTDVHLPDLARIPGVAAAQRFRFAPQQRDTAPPYPFGYLAIYELDEDAPTVFAGIDQANREGMVVSDAMAPVRVSHLWAPQSDRVTRPSS